ncbi:hypothetical protein NUM3379_37740 [Kineococcus sp. NUM-3379]
MSTSSSATTAPGAPPRQGLRAVDVLRGLVPTAALAVTANLIALVAGRFAGADMVVRQPGAAAQTIGVVHVVVATLVGLAAGALLLLVLRNRGPRAWTALAIAGLVVGLATTPAPFSTAAGTGTQVTLAAMHVLAGLVWFLRVRRGPRR